MNILLVLFTGYFLGCLFSPSCIGPSWHDFVPNDFCTATGFPNIELKRVIFSLRVFCESFDFGSQISAKWLANESDFFVL